jgi:hypothetical protein
MEVSRSMRIATEDDFLAASEIRKLVLLASHGYEYENNIRCAGAFNAVAVIEAKVVGCNPCDAVRPGPRYCSLAYVCCGRQGRRIDRAR